MEIVVTGEALRKKLLDLERPVVLVPTMGAFHEGHISLIRRARLIAGAQGTVVVSIFVNPIQFDRPADLAAYPRPMDEDLAVCLREQVDLVFTPEAEAMYFSDRSVTVTESLLSRNLCGSTRPGHFDGVCTVVLKLFLLTCCDVAVFGEKDFQQLAIVRRMVRDLDVPVKIISSPTIREADGLAMSSRNSRLNPEQRKAAPRIRKALLHTITSTSPQEIIKSARDAIESSLLAKVDYLELVDAESLQRVKSLVKPAILAAAVYFDDVRLIDHVNLDAR